MSKEFIVRRLLIIVENDSIGDNYWAPLVAKSLQEYAALVETQKAGHETLEGYHSPNGNKLTIIGDTWFGEVLPSEVPSLI